MKRTKAKAHVQLCQQTTSAVATKWLKPTQRSAKSVSENSKGNHREREASGTKFVKKSVQSTCENTKSQSKCGLEAEHELLLVESDSEVRLERSSPSKVNQKNKCIMKRRKSVDNCIPAKRRQSYKREWEKKFPWLQSSVMGPSWFHCIICAVSRKCAQDGITSVKRHGLGKAHRQNANSSLSSIAAANKMFLTANNTYASMRKEKLLNDRVRKLELQISMFILQNNLPFSLADDFVEFLKSIDMDSLVQKKFSCGKTKCTALICNVIGKYSAEKLYDNLRKDVFSLIIDESTDVSSVKHVVLCARRLDNDENGCEFCVKDDFLALLKVTDGTHEGLFTLIENFFNEHNIPYEKNMVGFGSDGANVIMSSENSVSMAFKRKIPYLFLSKCICHSLAKSVSNASEKLPAYLEQLLSQIYYYLRYSGKRQNALAELQSLLDIPEHRSLKLCQVRWLSLNSVIDRVIEEYPALVDYFELESKSDTSNEPATEIYDHLINPYTLIYLNFVSPVLKLVNTRNVLFQSEKPLTHELYPKMESLFKTIVSMYMDEDYIDDHDPEFIEFENETVFNKEYWKPLTSVNISPVAKADLLALQGSSNSEDKLKFRRACREFLIALAKEIYDRFPFKSKEVQFLKHSNFIDPANLTKVKDITEAANFFGYNVEEVNCEYQDICRTFKKETTTDICKFWKKVAAYTRHGDKQAFPLTVEIVRRILVIPYSSTNCKQTFSEVNSNCNRLETESLCGTLLAKNMVKEKSIFSINCDALISEVTNEIYE